MTEKVFIGIDNNRVELKDQELEVFLADQAALLAEVEADKAATEAKRIQRLELLNKLGLTENEAKLFLG
jgi:hypothetical protein